MLCVCWQDEEDFLLAKLHVFITRDQSAWGIADQSPFKWRHAVFELSGLERDATPSLRLNALVRTAKAIYLEFDAAVKPKLEKMGRKDLALGADDLLPIFIYVLCQAELSHPIVNSDILWNVCHPDQLHGESGYYLTLYESAVEYLLKEPFTLSEADAAELAQREMIARSAEKSSSTATAVRSVSTGVIPSSTEYQSAMAYHRARSSFASVIGAQVSSDRFQRSALKQEFQ